MAKQLKITWSKSTIGCPETQRRTIRSLGLRKLQHTVIKEDTPELRGQLKKVGHLITVEEID
ncbi:MAG: 50S ribosomal protein L30 [Syntrophomonadaceae bacterium]|jgi:large subunit ribosomal protein L30|nr:50S ribosomal protein L30 [Bacillota bacterium]NLM89287.1 50S ribosomal protein L30 [Syntrophomonadaceae bacterium]HAA08690.1 50S ribosomal protein L30 [Syntrophomonas sp.]HQA49515.1 50S ribosomal protein L30 [Syntrophomonadaceae bacterium]HQD90464.1 50S ribosomal protein L30 [Syntrophomonadaceae bacterium]